MKFRKKPIIIEAYQFKPEEWDLEGAQSMPGAVFIDKESTTGYAIYTLEGKHEVTPLDWIITGIKGETYPCKPDIFKMTYESLDEVRLKENMERGIFE